MRSYPEDMPPLMQLYAKPERPRDLDLRPEGITYINPTKPIITPLNEIARLLSSLTYGEMIELAKAIWAIGPITEATLPQVLHDWSKGHGKKEEAPTSLQRLSHPDHQSQPEAGEVRGVSQTLSGSPEHQAPGDESSQGPQG